MSVKKLKTTAIKGKQYVPVNERLKYFREHFKGYSLESELVEVNENTALIRGVIRNDQGAVVATGTAFERKDSKASMVNQTSHVENCETSAWGRALGNFGIGIDESVASADEVETAILNQDSVATKQTPVKTNDDVESVFGASGEQLRKIASLAKDLGMDVVNDIYTPMGVVGSPSVPQARAIIARLEEKLTEARNTVAAEESK